MNICKTCKKTRVLTTANYYLGRKFVWKCSCGLRLASLNEIPYHQLSKEERED